MKIVGLDFFLIVSMCKLSECTDEVDTQAQDMLELLMKQIAENQGITEHLKATDQMAWVGAMNNIKACAEEMVFKEIIFC